MAIVHSVTIDLEVDKPNDLTVVHAVQGEYYTRQVTANLYSDGSLYIIPTEAVALIRYRKPDGTVGFYDFDPSGNRIVTIPAAPNNTKVIFTLAPEMCDLAGHVTAHIDLYSLHTGYRLSVFNFLVEVEKAATDNEVIAQSNTSGLQGLVGEIIENIYRGNEQTDWRAGIIDNTLTMEGAVGEAKAMGDVVLVQSVQPNPVDYPSNKIWIDPDGLEDGIEIPEMAEVSGLRSSIAIPYDKTKTYELGDQTYFNNQLYTCIVPITAPEEWVPEHWISAVITEDLYNFKKQINDDYYNIRWISGGYVNRYNGQIHEHASWLYTDFIDINLFDEMRTSYKVASEYNGYYDKNYTYLGSFTIESGESGVAILSRARYVRLSIDPANRDTSHIKFYPSLSEQRAQILNMNNFERIRLPYYFGSHVYDETESNGLTFVWYQNHIHVYGTCTQTRAWRFYNLNPDTVDQVDDSWIRGDCIYYMNMHRNNYDASKFRIRHYVDKNGSDYLIDDYVLNEPSAFTLHCTENTTWLYIEIFVPEGATVDSTFTYELFYAPPYEKYSQKTIRVMQNNVGVFRYGRTQAQYDITEEEYQEKLRNYKELYAAVKPDVVCLQEFVRTIGPNNNLRNTNDVLYGPLFSNSLINPNTNSKQQAIYSNLNGRMQVTSYNYIDGTPGGSTYAEFITNENNIHIVTFALSADEGNDAGRYRQMISMLADFDKYNNVIICADMNMWSQEEADIIIALLKEHGFKGASQWDTYWGSIDTYINVANQADNAHYYRKIDSIFVKGKLKILNTRALWDETTWFPENYVADKNYSYLVMHPSGYENPSEKGWYMAGESYGGRINNPYFYNLILSCDTQVYNDGTVYYKRIAYDFDLVQKIVGTENPKELGWYIRDGFNYVKTEDTKVVYGTSYYHTYLDDYEPMRPNGTENPYLLGWYEELNNVYQLTLDSEVNEYKTYYTYYNGIYEIVTPIGSENPSALDWYEKLVHEYILTSDTEINENKNYYTRIDQSVNPQGNENPSALRWYEFINRRYLLSSDTTVNPSKTYYKRREEQNLMVSNSRYNKLLSDHIPVIADIAIY